MPRADRIAVKEAVRTGLLAACSMGPRYVGFWDADLATPLEDIPVFTRLLDKRPDIEMVFGSRINLLGRNVHRTSPGITSAACLRQRPPLPSA
jgi:hypothetical protein